MVAPVLLTKLSVPPPRPRAIPRRRLVEQLNEGVHRKLTLISAPAGFGKTTLVSEWIADANFPVAWLSLEERDSDLSRFLIYLIAALQNVEPTIGDGMESVLQRARTPPVETVLTALINGINTIDTRIVLVLDDYHLIDAPAVDDALAFLLDHMPAQLHLVITTREDPLFPLARLRAREEMIELRAADLRFTPDEAVAFLSEVMGLSLPTHDVATLEARTEGWIAGLQMAALSMRGLEDASSFVQAFAGDDRYIVDYLVEEVLDRQPGHVRDFLLQTSILDRLSGSLCNAVTGRNDGREVLRSLERANLFVIPLDGKRDWYRYHHLFADVLRAHAVRQDPVEIALRHRRASEWFEKDGSQADAIQHALAAGDPARAAGMIELAALRMLGTSEEGTMWGWLQSIPDELVRRMPVLSVYYGFAAFGHAGLDVAETRFRDAERWLGAGANDRGDMIVVNEPAFASLPGTIAVGRAYLAGSFGDVDGIVRSARRAIDVMPESDDLWNGAASAVLGIGLWTLGELGPAFHSFEKGKARLERAGFMQFQVVGVHILADIRIAQGRLREAERIYADALRLATEHGDHSWGTSDIYVGLGDLLRERNDLEGAARFLLMSRGGGTHAGLPDTRHRWYIAMAHLREAQGDIEDALDLLDQAARQYVPGADPDLRPISALRVRLWLEQGRIAEAVQWARDRTLAIDDDLSYLSEFEHMTFARVLIARFRIEHDERALRDAIGLLDRLLVAATKGERTGSTIANLVLLALAHEARDDIPAALASLERALAHAEPEGYVRIFTGEDQPMARLLSEASRRGIMPEYAERLLSAFGHRASPPGRDMAPVRSQALAEQLTDREMEVLRLIADGLSNQQIGDRLFLALSTVKGHNREIFGKLGVKRRTEAVARARELNIL